MRSSPIPFGFRTAVACGAVFALALLLRAVASPSDPVIETKSGRLQGTVGTTTIEYLGIPYAAPPVGMLRWMPPQAYGKCREFSKPQPPGASVRSSIPATSSSAMKIASS